MSNAKPLFAPGLPKAAGAPLRWAGLTGASQALAIHAAASAHSGPCLVITADTPTALMLESELQALQASLPVLLFPDWETLPYDQFSPHQDIISQRLATLHQLRSGQRAIVLAPVTTLLLRTAPPAFLDRYSLVLKAGDRLGLEQMRERLNQAGYALVQQVLEHGEYAVRGSLLDLYPMGASQPLRVDFLDDEVDSIRPFDVESQRSLAAIDQIRLLPAHEFPTDSSGIEGFRIRYRQQFEVSNHRDSLYQQVTRSTLPAGIEYYLPLFFDASATLFDYLGTNALAIGLGDLNASAEQFWLDLRQRYEDRRIDPLRPLLPPEMLFLKSDELGQQLNLLPRVQIGGSSDKVHVDFGCRPLPDLAIHHGSADPLARLRQFSEQFAGRWLLVAETAGRREQVHELVARHQLPLNIAPSLEAFLAGDERAAMVVGPWHQGFVHGDDRFALITEQELFGARIEQRSKSRERERGVNPELLIRNLAELRVGQPVVHVNHGVGRYLGLEKIAAGGIEAEFMALEYAGSSKLYVPVASLHLISRYSGDSDQPPLHKLGSETWAKARAKAAEQVRDVAAELLEIYARRAAKPGFAFAIDESAYTAFAADFRYVETADQAAAIGAVLRDMSLPVAMDRLVCGDVGFGKTEVAMRAAFIAVHNQKQVAVLVPTTLLAQQHFENFRDRFANQPVRIEVMSRFRSAAEQKKVLEDLVAGKVDIVIGTHKLLQKEVKFADLGLLIVDEEHRFGVRQKEQIKALRADVDILTLTATPIPRTLNMAIGGMRDLSIIATPPARRLAVRTFVRQWDGPTIREAVMRELLRGGQVFYLHNEVETIANELEKLQKIVPEARLRIAHGQMAERELEAVMSDFYHQRFNVLLCSTIIETGIDIPSANTIIINRADHLGLAQLHQLRGRVGRSHHQAYAYLMTPPPKLLTPDATKRLEAVAQLQDLGAGFALATHDLEIRGAGELLGDDQSGQINAIGFSLYMEMLEEAVKALREGRQIDNDTLLADTTELELRIPALLPDDYIPDVNLRLSLYKRIAGCDDEAGLDELKVEMIDRFGLLPEQAKNLFAIARLRQLAEAIGVRRIDAGPQGVSLEFRSSTAVDPTAIIRLIQSRPSDYKLEGASKLRLFRANHNASERLAAVAGLLTALGAPAAATALSAQGVCA